MKYLLYGTLALLFTATTVRAQDIDYASTSYNEDVNRKFNLDFDGAIEVLTDVRFHPWNADEVRSYYYVLPHSQDHNLISLSAVVASSQNEATVKKVDVSTIPRDL